MTSILLMIGDNRILFEDLPTYIDGLSVANLVWAATRHRSRSNAICDSQTSDTRRQIFKYDTVIPILKQITLFKQKD